MQASPGKISHSQEDVKSLRIMTSSCQLNFVISFPGHSAKCRDILHLKKINFKICPRTKFGTIAIEKFPKWKFNRILTLKYSATIKSLIDWIQIQLQQINTKRAGSAWTLINSPKYWSNGNMPHKSVKRMMVLQEKVAEEIFGHWFLSTFLHNKRMLSLNYVFVIDFSRGVRFLGDMFWYQTNGLCLIYGN